MAEPWGSRPAPVLADPAPVLESRNAIPPTSLRGTKLDQAWMVWCGLATGVVLRILYYSSGRALWIDEARVALNIGTRSYSGLLRPLDYDQAAPPLFLWGEKLATQLFGMNERALWILPLLAGLVSLALFVPLARRFLPGWTGVIAVVSLSVAPTLVHFSSNAKPYVGDLAFALAILVGACAWIERPGSWMARSLPLIGVIAAWGSTPAIFTLAPAGVALFLGAGRERRGRAVVIGLLWLASFAAAYVLVYEPSAHSGYLERFWRHAFLVPGDPPVAERLADIRRDIFSAFSFGLYDPPTAPLVIPVWFIEVQQWGSRLFVLLAVVGAAALVWMRARWESVLLFGPVALLIAASALGRYPASTRLVLFLVPVFYLSFSAGGALLLAMLGPVRRRLAARAVTVLLLGSQLTMSVRYLQRCPAIENIRGMVALLDRAARAPQVVYVQAGALPAWAFYTTNWRRPDSTRLARYAVLGASDGAGFENAPSRGRVAPGEGWDLRLTYGNRLELQGIAAGVWLRPKVPGAGKVDVGWVDNEVQRIRRAAECQGIAWVLTSHAQGADDLLLKGLESAGGRATYAMHGLIADLTRFELEDEPTAECSSR